MAKKYEFQPDKPRSSWLSKLYLTKLQRKNLLKWFLYGMILLVLSLLQDVVLCRFRLFGATTELVPVGILLICVMEGAQKGSVFALVASALYVFSGTAAGPHAMVGITIMAIVVCIFRQAYLQKTFFALLLCVAFAMVVYEALIFLVAIFLGNTFPDRWIGFAFTTGLSLIAVPILYPLVAFVSSIGGETWKE